jgi:hypothetical protein
MNRKSGSRTLFFPLANKSFIMGAEAMLIGFNVWKYYKIFMLRRKKIIGGTHRGKTL